MNAVAIKLIESWCDSAVREIDEYFKWEDAFEFAMVDYENEQYIGLYHMPDGSDIFPMDVPALRKYAGEYMKEQFFEYAEGNAETTLSAGERNR